MRQACPAFVLPLVLFCFSLTGPVVAQNGPYVMIHVDIDGGLKANANGVVIGRHDDHAVIITNAHVALQATAITVQIGNQSHLAKIRNVDAANDFMILIIDGDFHDLRYALMAVEVPVGTRLKYCGFLPQNQWRLGCIPTRRIRNDRLRWYALDLRAVGGMSGGGIYTLDGHLAAILSLSQDGQTQVIPTPVIRRRLVEWGYVNGAVKGSIPDHHRPQQTPQQAEKNETAKESEPPKKAELAIKEAAASSTETKDEPKPEPVKPIEKIKDVAIFGARTYIAMKYGGVLAAVTGAAGWAGWLIGKRNERKRGGDPASTVSSVNHNSDRGSPEALRETQERVVSNQQSDPHAETNRLIKKIERLLDSRQKGEEGRRQQCQPPFPRHLDEANELRRLRQSEGRVAALDALVGMIFDDRVKETLETSDDENEKKYIRNLRDQIMDQVDLIAPIATPKKGE